MKYHLAILREPYLSLILQGKKTAESRWTQKKILPYLAVEKGDLIYLKKSGGKIFATAIVERVLYFQALTLLEKKELIDQYNTQLQIQQDFIDKKLAQSQYISLIFLTNVRRIAPIPYQKNDQRSWLILKSPLDVSYNNLLL